ncbi:hypothetical protein CKA32_002598 [Geitlerinema sp. FC II]|nr:hypothetical protein CKA32_002598 [Geitlerinema sp. FC II]
MLLSFLQEIVSDIEKTSLKLDVLRSINLKYCFIKSLNRIIRLRSSRIKAFRTEVTDTSSYNSELAIII